MKYSLATNFDSTLIENISNMDTDNSIKVVFGKLRTDSFGGGRASMILPELSMQELEKHIKLCHEKNIEFNYLLNPACMANKELEKESHNQIIRYIENLMEIGIDWVTLVSPYLCEVIRKKFPNLKISIGLYANVFNLQHITYWQNLGADEITLQHFNNRNFDLLEKMLLYTKNSSISLRLIANNACLHFCPYQQAHATGQAHASVKNEESQKFYLDYNLLKCIIEKIENPVQLISSDWIRPEDVKYYDDLCRKTDNYNLSMKIVDRTKPTSFLTKAARAYLSRSYKGNLLDLMLWPSDKEIANLNMPADEKMAETMKRFFEVFNLPKVYIDNTKLDGFLEHFINKYDCNEKICERFDDNLKTYNELTHCSYCKSWAKKAINVDEKKVECWLAQSYALYKDLCESRIFA